MEYPSQEEMHNFLIQEGWVRDVDQETALRGAVYCNPEWDNCGMKFGIHAAYVICKNVAAKTERDEAARNRVAQILCNKCGSDLSKYDGEQTKQNHMGYYGLVHQTYKTGYCSEALPDGNRYIFSLCEKCLAELFTSFKTPPIEEHEL